MLALADLVVLLNEGAVAAFQSPAKLSDALAMGLPVLVSNAAPLLEMTEKLSVMEAEPQQLAKQLCSWLCDNGRLRLQGQRGRDYFLETLDRRVVSNHLSYIKCTRSPCDAQQMTVLRGLLSTAWATVVGWP